jgi:hypothetical protein
MINFFLISFLCFNAYASHHDADAADGLESELNLRIFKKYQDNVRFLIEFKLRNEAEDNKVKSFKTGGYVRTAKNWKVGLFYERLKGVLHSDDWSKKWQGGKWTWLWDDTSDRTEEMLTLDVTYRKLFAKDWVFELKNRFTHNDYNHNKFLRVRPGLTYFWKKDAMPFINWFFQYEVYLPQNNYSEVSVYEIWGYAGILYHLHSNYKIGGFMARKKVTWTSGEVKSNVLGMNIFYYF